MTTKARAASRPENWNEEIPVIANPDRVIREDRPVPSFGENIWKLEAMAPERYRLHFTCNFDSIPFQFRLPVKKAVWLLINEGKPSGAISRGGTKAKKWVALGTITHFVNDVRSFLQYVTQQTPEVRSMRGIVSETMDAFVGSLQGRLGVDSAASHYNSIRLLHDGTCQPE